MQVSTFTLNDLWEQFAASLPGSLLSARDRCFVRNVAEAFPPLSGFGLEYHLCAPTGVDFLIRATRSVYDRSESEAWHERLGATLRRQALQDASWGSLSYWFDHWLDGRSAFFCATENLWLEFDNNAEALSGSLPLPSVFFDLDRNRTLDPQISRHGLLQSFEKLNRPVSIRAQKLIREGMELVAPFPAIHYAGAMLSRADSGQRLCLSGISVHDLETYLYAWGWKGHNESLRFLLQHFASMVDRMVLDVDVTEYIHDRIGLELYPDSREQWHRLFVALEEHGLMCEEEAQALQQVPGTGALTDLSLMHHLSAGMKKPVRYLARRLNHVKLTLQGDGSTQAKVYLYLSYF